MQAYVEYIVFETNFSLVLHRKHPNSHITLSYNVIHLLLTWQLT